MNLGGTFNGQTTREDFKAAFSLASLAPHRADEPATIGRCSCRLADSGGEKTAVLRPARTGEKQSAKLAGTRVARRECRKVPGLTQEFTIGRLKRQIVLA